MKVATLETKDSETFYFASLDGERYIGVSRRPQPGEDDEIRNLMEGTDGFLPMTIHKRALTHFTTGDTVSFEDV